MKSPREQGITFFQYWRRNLRGLLVIAVSIFFLEQASCLERVDSVGIDWLVRAFPAPVSGQIFLVKITDDDYHQKNRFDAISPLKVDAVVDLLEAIKHGNPKVIGVDLDTADITDPVGHLANLRQDSRFIWAEVPNMPEPIDGDQVIARELKQIKVFQDIRTALPILPQDRDGMIRTFRNSFNVLNGNEQLRFPALGCAVAQAYDPLNVDCRDEKQVRRFSFAGSHEDFPATDVASLLDHPENAGAVFRGKIVLVGGTYRAARDSYMTPAGELSGLEIIANAAQSYFPRGGFIKDSPPVLGLLFDLLIGSLLVLLYWDFRLRISFWSSILLGPVVAMLLSWSIFAVFRWWLPFAPVFAAMLIHLLHDYSELIEEQERLG